MQAKETKMRSVLFFVKPPQRKHEHLPFSQTATGFWSCIKEPGRLGEDAIQLAENVWILDLQKSISTLAWLVSCAELHELSYGILPLDHEAQWLPADFDPKPLEKK
jgi:hypothetical protein